MREELLQATEEICPILEQWQGWGEANGRLADDVVAALRGMGIAKLCLPEALGGYEVDPVTTALICQRLADSDPSAAWFVMVFNAARLMSAGWPEETLERLFLDQPDIMLAASGHTAMQGRVTDSGFSVSGRNSFVSGCHHADYIMSPMMVEERPYFVVLPAAQCQVVDNWDTLGMRGTGSNDVIAEDVQIPSVLAIPTDKPAQRSKYHSGRLYNCPSRVVFATYIPAALSLARRALTELEDLAANKVPYASDGKLKLRSQAQMHYGRALAKYRATRAYFLTSLEEVWSAADDDKVFHASERADLYLAGTHTMQTCAEIVRHVADAAGSTVFHKGQPLERIARDMETLKHHGFANESRYASVAQALWDAPLDYPLMMR